MKRRTSTLAAVLGAALALPLALLPTGCGTTPDIETGSFAAHGWLSWRGPEQNGRSRETGLPEPADVDGNKPTWRYDLSGRGTPVIANGRVYTMGYEGEGKELEEVLVCLDENTGERIWEQRFQHFLTDIIYYRFAIGSPTIDAATGNVFCITSAGLLCSFTADGELRWQHALGAEYGRLVFPNGRTGAVALTDEHVVLHMTTSGWGPQGPARGRFFAFDKDDGASAWTSTPGGPPKDISFSLPVVEQRGGRLLTYAGLSGGHMTCVDARTGDALWRFPMCTGGMSSSAVLYKDTLIAIHGKENLDSSTAGRMVAIKLGALPGKDGKQLVLGADHEKWRNHLTAFTSSPVLVDDRVYTTIATGELACVNADTGEVLWEHKLAPDQIHASPAFGDGLLWVPMNNGSLFVIRPTDAAAEVLTETTLEGNCLGAPAICNGRVYVHTTKALYCFAGEGSQQAPPAIPAPTVDATPGAATRLQVLPADVLVRTGETIQFRARSLDADGNTVADPVAGAIEWTGKLTDGMRIDAAGKLTIAADATPTALVLKASSGGVTGTARVRVVPSAPYTDDLEDVALQPHPKEDGVNFAFPRAHWISARLKWEVRERDGNKVLARTLDQPLFQRTISMIGAPDMANYTMQVDVMTDGNRRIMSTPGMVNQRYLILLKGNHQALEITSNEELLKERVKFRWKPKVWYRMKSRVDVAPDGSGVVRAKAWQRDEPEPDGWLLEVEVPRANRSGSPGIYGFTPQSRFRCYVDNIVVTPND
jgi:outer membrane protein assembly factor BamB